MEDDQYYFAYGSNISQKQMEERCPDSKVIGIAILNDYTLAFTKESKKWNGGVADIIPHKNKKTYGILYKVSSKDIRNLDKYEGAPKAYKRVNVEVNTLDGRNIQALTYKVVDKKENIIPGKEYLRLLIISSKENKLPHEYINFLESFENV